MKNLDIFNVINGKNFYKTFSLKEVKNEDG